MYGGSRKFHHKVFVDSVEHTPPSAITTARMSALSSAKVAFLCLLVLSFSIVAECHFLHMLQRMQQNAACKPNCCKAVKCAMPKCKAHQVMKPNAGWCGCCPKCMTQLKMGSSCMPKPKKPCQMMPTSECGCGLKCKQFKCCR